MLSRVALQIFSSATTAKSGNKTSFLTRIIHDRLTRRRHVGDIYTDTGVGVGLILLDVTTDAFLNCAPTFSCSDHYVFWRRRASERYWSSQKVVVVVAKQNRVGITRRGSRRLARFATRWLLGEGYWPGVYPSPLPLRLARGVGRTRKINVYRGGLRLRPGFLGWLL